MNKTVAFVRMFCVVVICACFVPTMGAVAASRASRRVVGPAPDPNSQSDTVVATIGDYTITREELAQRLVQEIQPRDEEFPEQTEPATAVSVLRKMLAEKAMSMEGRRLGYLEDEQLRPYLLQYEREQLGGYLLQAELGPKLTIDDADVDRVMQNNPKVTRDRALAMVRQAKVRQLVSEYYAEVKEKRHLQKMDVNVARTAQIYQRLLNQPVQPRGPNVSWVQNKQIVTDLSDEERGLVLAAFDGGQFTLKDWFLTVCNIAPPRRPKDLGTPQGAERLLDAALQPPVFAAEAEARGYDQVPTVRSRIQAREDQRLLSKVQSEKAKEIQEPTPEQVKEYFEKNPERFATSAVLKVGQIWCADEQTAQKVKTLLDEGTDFQTARQEYSLQKDVEVYTQSPASEGIFWADLWKGEPNQILGPMLGFYSRGVKWRIVKVVEKTPAQAQPFSEQLANTLKWMLQSEWRQQILKDYEQELLEKYPYELFSDRIQDMDPLEIAMQQQDG